MTNKSKYHYDYIIIGNGLAGFQLALAFNEDVFFKDKKIALIDPSPKNINDKTWCFWEEGNGKWDSIVYKSWSKNRFISPNINIVKTISPFKYKMIRSLDFYTYAKNNLQENYNVSFVKDSILKVEIENGKVITKGQLNQYSCNHLFDSRIPVEFYSDKKSIKLIQHFKGYTIECNEDVFVKDEFTMMDYRLSFNQTTSFSYVLPLTSKKALIEFTFFTENIVDEVVYDEYLVNYIENYLNISEYKIVEIEKGQIPMTNFDFAKHNTASITKIGTGGGWVKGSTGYSFKNTERKVEKIKDNLKLKLPPAHNLFTSKYHFYDTIFLQVLKDYNNKGVEIFEKFYSKNEVEDYLAFLDENSTLNQDIKIMSSLFSPLFISSLFKYISNKL